MGNFGEGSQAGFFRYSGKLGCLVLGAMLLKSVFEGGEVVVTVDRIFNLEPLGGRHVLVDRPVAGDEFVGAPAVLPRRIVTDFSWRIHRRNQS